MRQESAQLRRSDLLLLRGGIFFSLASVISYFGWSLHQPESASYTWVQEVLTLAGMLMAAFGWWRLPPSRLRRLGFASACMVSLALPAYVHIYTARLPSTEGVIKVGTRAPPFELPGPDGAPVALSRYLGKTLVLVFYRGYW